MRSRSPWKPLLVMSCLLAAAGCSKSSGGGGGSTAEDTEDCSVIPALKAYADWPQLASAVKQDPATEARIASLVAGMSIEEKVGQMVQGEIRALQAGDVKTYHLGSVLSGGGAWPGNDKHAAPAAWLALADQYWDESMDASNAHRIPIFWGIDAVHGHNNVYGSTLFPHNIGLGAMRDACVMHRIGAAVAQQLRVTGQDWTFAPTLAVVRDDRWGRTYEGFSEYPNVTRKYAVEYFKGLQDNDGTRLHGILGTAKHYLGDGGTLNGTNEGVDPSSELDMVNLHAQGYYGALGAGGGQTVMISFNSWTNAALGIEEGKVHGSRYLITDVLKGKLGFDGLTITDWNGHGQIPGCTAADCPRAVNAGIDLFMISSRDDVIAFIANTIAETQLAADDPRHIPLSRIDDAVTRILRVKTRAGLFDAPKPSLRAHAGVAGDLQFRALAQEAVQKSAVLLKNDGGVLPLARGGKVLVVGPSAASFQHQTGGWTISWQGSDTSNDDFPVGQTLLDGVKAVAGEASVTYSADGAKDDAGAALDYGAYDAVVAVLAEGAYAETSGDIDGTHTLELKATAQAVQADLTAFDAVTAGLAGVTGKTIPVVTILYSGRPLYVNEQLNRSDAFVAAFLPGTEAGALANLLFKTATGAVDRDFTGTLSYSWPASACQTPVNVGDPSYAPLFPYGHGLVGGAPAADLGAVDYQAGPAEGCNPPSGGGAPAATEPLVFFADGTVHAGYSILAGSGHTNSWAGVVMSDTVPLPAGGVTIAPDADLTVTAADLHGTKDALRAAWNPTNTGFDHRVQLYVQQTSGATDLSSYFPSADAFLMFDVDVAVAPDPANGNQVTLRVGSPWPNVSNLDFTKALHDRVGAGPTTVKVPLRCFKDNANPTTHALPLLDFTNVNETFLLIADQPLDLVLGNVRWVPDDGNQLDFIPCNQLPWADNDPAH